MQLYILFITLMILLPGFIKASLDADFQEMIEEKRGMGLRLPHLVRLNKRPFLDVEKRRLGSRLPNLVRMRRLQDSQQQQLFPFL